MFLLLPKLTQQNMLVLGFCEKISTMQLKFMFHIISTELPAEHATRTAEDTVQSATPVKMQDL